MIYILAAGLPEHLSILGFLPAHVSPSPSLLFTLFFSYQYVPLYCTWCSYISIYQMELKAQIFLCNFCEPNFKSFSFSSPSQIPAGKKQYEQEHAQLSQEYKLCSEQKVGSCMSIACYKE